MSIRKRADFKNLAKSIEYIEIDQTPASDGYFEIIDFPEKFTAGKNIFKLRMQNDRFVDNSEVLIEILDFNGNPVYFEPLKYLEKDGTRVVSVYIYPETSPGPAVVSIAARISSTRSGEEIPFSYDPASPDYFGIPNLLWQRTLPIAPYANNTTEIIYTKQPSVTITEVIQPYRQPVQLFNIFSEVSSSNSTYSLKAPRGTTPIFKSETKEKVESISGENKTTNIESVDQPEKTVFEGQFSKNSPNKEFGKQIVDSSNLKEKLKETTSTETTSEVIRTVASTSQISFTNFPLSKSMEGGTLTLVNPLINAPAGTKLNSLGQALPSSQTDESTQSLSARSTVPLSGSYVFNIVDIITKNVAFIAQVSGFKNSLDNTFGAFEVELDNSNFGNEGKERATTSQFTLVQSLETSTNVTASFIKPSETIFTENSSSFADIIVADTEPASGDVYRMKTLFKPSGFFGDFLDLGDTILEQQNILIDTGSFETNITIGSFYENFGQFESLQEIQKYWSGSVVGGLPGNAVTLSYDVDTLIGGAQIDTNWQASSGVSKQASKLDASIFEIQNKYRPIIYRGTTYVLRFRVALPPDIADYTNLDSELSFPRLDIYAKNDIIQQNPIQNVTIGDVTGNAKVYSTQAFKDGGDLGIRIGSVLANKIPGAIISVEYQFKALSTEPLDLKFVTRTGAFILADISVLADKETGYTPGYVRISKRIPTEHLKTPLTFKFQYFDIQGNKADLETFAYGAVFNGGNTYIDGTGNLLTGSIFVGSAVASGIEIAGVSSGFLRSIGYVGSNKAKDGSGPGGFILYSGSNALNIGTNNYTGVGLELVSDNDRSHLIFTTSGSGEVDIKAEKFFIGTTGSQFISGANSNIEISSSLFHLDPQNDLLIIGADAVINADLSANQLFVPAGTNKSNARAYISSSGEAAFIGDGAGNYSVVLDGRTGQTSTIAGLTASAHSLSTTTYTISASTNTSDPVSFISSSAFKVSAGGAITGSAVLLGDKSAGNFLQFVDDTLTVQGNITADNIRTPATIGGSPSTDSNASSSITSDGFAKFVSASIAGFTVNTEEIKSTNEALRLKSSGDITASKVLLEGGTITAGVTILGSVSANSILTPATIGGSPSTPANASSSISSEGLAIFRSASIAGFVVNSEEIKSANESLRLKASGQITGSNVLFTGGEIGGFTIDNDHIVDSDGNLQLTGSSGTIKARAGTIGGFTLSSDKITGDNIIIDSAGSIQTSDYASDLKGWKISAADNGFAEFENAKIRGTLSTAVFEKETVNAVGGQLYVANSTNLTASADNPNGNYLPTDTTMSVVNVSGFAANEILSLKKVSSTGFSTEYVRVNSASRNDSSSDTDLSGKLFVIRGYSGSSPANQSTASLGDSPGTAQSYSGSQVIVSTGKIGTGFIRLNANPNDQATPYIDIVERTGSAIYDVLLKARLGDLSGLANSDIVFNRSNPGFGLATDNVFLQGGITATFGTIGGFAITSNAISSSNNNLILRDSGQITGSTVLFTGGDIGGFVLSSDEIRSSNDNLRLKSSGQITGSNVLFDGGKVGNWHIGQKTLKALDGSTERIRLDANSGELQIDGDDAVGITIGGSSTNLINVTSLPFFVAAKDDGSRTIFRVGDANQFIKFDTGGTPKLFISSSNYLLGGSSQFISGSNGNIEISSSNFHLDRDGNVDMSGTITATAGEIGGFSIDGHSLSTTGVEINDSTQTLFISSSAFKVDHTGNITGSQVLFEGGRITSGVTIEGSVTANAIRTPATIGGSPSTTANASSSIDADGFAKFASASIAGFTITDEQILAEPSRSIIATNVSASFTMTTDTGANTFVIMDSFTTNASYGYKFWSSSLARGTDDAGNIFDKVFVKRTVGSFLGKSFLRGGAFQVEGQIENSNILNNATDPFDGALEITLESGDTVAFDDVNAPSVFCNSDESLLILVSHSIVVPESPLRLKSNGQITASNADISGKIVTEDITATGGTIGGLSLSNSSLSTTEYVISSSTNTSDPVSFISSSAFKVSAGGNITGSQVLFTGGTIGGTTIESDKLNSTSNLSSPDSSPTFQLDSSGVISGSNLYVRKVTDLGSGNEIIPLLDTRIGLLDGRNLGRQLVSNYDEFVRSNVDDNFTFVTVNEHFVQLLPYENTLLISYQLRVDATGNGVQGSAKFQLQTMTHSGSFLAATNFDNFTDAASVNTSTINRTSSGTSIYIAAGALAAKLTIPESAQAQTCRIQVEMLNNMISSLSASPSNKTTLKGYSIIATRALAANTAGNSAEELNKGGS